MLLLGGTGVPFGEAASNQLNVCNLGQQQWKHIPCTGDPPIRVYGHASELLSVSAAGAFILACQNGTRGELSTSYDHYSARIMGIFYFKLQPV